MKRGRSVLAALVLLAAPGEALACACCTNLGQRYVEVEKLDSGRLEQIESLRFGAEARLHVGEAGVEYIKGIQNPAERYDLKVDSLHPRQSGGPFGARCL